MTTTLGPGPCATVAGPSVSRFFGAQAGRPSAADIPPPPLSIPVCSAANPGSPNHGIVEHRVDAAAAEHLAGEPIAQPSTSVTVRGRVPCRSGSALHAPRMANRPTTRPVVLGTDGTEGSCSCSGTAVRARPGTGTAQFLVEAECFFELVFQDDDAAGGLQGGALVDQLAGAGGQAQLVARVAPVSPA